MASFLGFEAPTRAQAITAYIDARFRPQLDENTQATPDLNEVRAWALSLIEQQPQIYTEPQYIEARRWQQQPDTLLTLDTGRLSAMDYATRVVVRYEKEQKQRRLTISLLRQAKTVDEIQAILVRRL